MTKDCRELYHSTNIFLALGRIGRLQTQQQRCRLAIQDAEPQSSLTTTTTRRSKFSLRSRLRHELVRNGTTSSFPLEKTTETELQLV